MPFLRLSEDLALKADTPVEVCSSAVQTEPCPSQLFGCCDKGHNQKQLGGRKDLFGLYLPITVYHWVKSGRELKQSNNLDAGTEAEAKQECCLQICSFCLALLAFWYTLAPPAQRWHHPQWAKPFHTNQEILHKLQYDEGIFSIEGPSSQIALTSVKLIKHQMF